MLNAVQYILAVNLFFFLLGGIKAQEDPLDKYLVLIESVNPAMIVNQLEADQRQLAVDLADAQGKLRVDLLSDYVLSRGGRTLDFPIGDLFNPIYGTLNQLTGQENFPTNLENINEQLAPNNFHDTRLRLTYPILQPAIAAQSRLRQSQAGGVAFDREVLMNQLKLQFKQLYYAYQQSETGQLLIDEAATVLRELLRVNRSLVSNDLATREIIYRTEAELAGLAGDRAALEQQQLMAQAGMNRLLNRELSSPIDISQPPAIDSAYLATSLVQLQQTAKANRPEKAQLSNQAEVLNNLSDLETAQGRPTLGVSLQAGFQGFFNGDLSDHPYVLLGTGFQWNLVDGKQRKLRQQQIAVQRLQLDQQKIDTDRRIEQEVFVAYHRLRTLVARLEAASMERRAATESFRLAEIRYQNQKAILLEVLDARRKLTDSRLSENLLQFDYLQQLAALEAAMSN